MSSKKKSAARKSLRSVTTVEATAAPRGETHPFQKSKTLRTGQTVQHLHAGQCQVERKTVAEFGTGKSRNENDALGSRLGMYKPIKISDFCFSTSVASYTEVSQKRGPNGRVGKRLTCSLTVQNALSKRAWVDVDRLDVDDKY